ncbi:MAG: DUF3105 domain-containing protein [Actinomycetota bacterium]|nr:DUF3105 domain-containing protein [Actinomycetota bacterium]
MKLFEPLAIILISLTIAVGVIVLLSGGLLAGRDNPGIYGSSGALGVQFRDLGDRQLAAKVPDPRYDSTPPTSGAHHPAKLEHDATGLSDDQLLQALAAGNVVFMYGTPRPPSGLRALADSIAAPFSPALAAAGQAVIVARRPGTTGVLGLAWTHLVHVRIPADPQLRSFTLFWLGQGAGGHIARG